MRNKQNQKVKYERGLENIVFQDLFFYGFRQNNVWCNDGANFELVNIQRKETQ